jgi:hypothetical protein
LPVPSGSHNRGFDVGLGLLFWIVFGITLGVEWNGLPKEAAAGLLGFLIFGALTWLFVGLFYINSGIRASRITERWLEIVGIDKRFARQWNEVEEDPMPSKKKYQQPVDGE